MLTTAALGALALQDARSPRSGWWASTQLPAYAAHLTGHPQDRGHRPRRRAAVSDVVWYPNQIDGRSNIAAARRLGARVVTTYLDLIAYDIPRYHGSPEAWQAYRALQRRIALSVDGITTISADVGRPPARRRCRGSTPSGSFRCRSAWTTSPPTRRRSSRASDLLDLREGARRASRSSWCSATTSSTRTATSRSGSGRRRCRRASRATSSSPDCTSRAASSKDARGRPHRPPPRPARAHPHRRARLVGTVGPGCWPRRSPPCIRRAPRASASCRTRPPYWARRRCSPTSGRCGRSRRCRGLPHRGPSSSTPLIWSPCSPTSAARDAAGPRIAASDRPAHVVGFAARAGRVLRARHPPADGADECRGRGLGGGGHGSPQRRPVEPHLAGDRVAASHARTPAPRLGRICGGAQREALRSASRSRYSP